MEAFGENLNTRMEAIEPLKNSTLTACGLLCGVAICSGGVKFMLWTIMEHTLWLD